MWGPDQLSTYHDQASGRFASAGLTRVSSRRSLPAQLRMKDCAGGGGSTHIRRDACSAYMVGQTCLLACWWPRHLPPITPKAGWVPHAHPEHLLRACMRRTWWCMARTAGAAQLGAAVGRCAAHTSRGRKQLSRCKVLALLEILSMRTRLSGKTGHGSALINEAMF